MRKRQLRCGQDKVGFTSLSSYLRSLKAVKGCDTWFSLASKRSLSDLLVLPGILSLMRLGILSLILDRHPLPPPLLLLLPLSLPPPGCQPPFAILRRLDMMFLYELFGCKSALSHYSPRVRPFLVACPAYYVSPHTIYLVYSYQARFHRVQSDQRDMPFQSILSYAIRHGGDISNRQSQLQDAALPSVLATNHSDFLLSDHAHLSHRW